MQMGFNLLFKPKYNQLACGLFGAAAGEVSKININKLKILGIYNDIRGGHSCGMSIDGDIILGTYKDKLFKDFISTYNISTPQVLPVVLGHTRMATGGTHNESNAHPFGFGNNGDYYDFIGTHNGTLHNEDELAEEYNVSTKATVFENNKTIVRNKIDSEILLEIIYENGFKVLEKYQGAAALAMYNTKKANTLYLYHGASSKIANGDIVEERPLFYYQESENVVYYSSLKNSLEAINDTNGEIKEFDYNIVYEIRSGNVEKAKKHIIDRNKCSQINSSCSYNSRYDHSKYSQTNNYYKDRKWCPTEKAWIKEEKKEVDVKILNVVDILYENFTNYFYNKRLDTSKVYYENLRFYQNKKLLDGIYVLDNKNNLVYVCTHKNSFDVCIDFIQDLNTFNKIIPLYFVKGIQLISEKDYLILQNNNTFEKFNLAQLSHCSVYPIRDIKLKNSTCYYKGELATLNFSPIHTLDVIKLINGKCTLIEERKIENTSYFLSDDKLLFNNNLNIIESKENQCDDSVVVELYKENLLATVEYCTEDCDVSLVDNYVKSQIKSKLKEIEKFILKLLTI